MHGITDNLRSTAPETQSQFRLQRRVGLILVAASILSAMLNLFSLVFSRHLSLTGSLATPYVWLLVLLAGVSVPFVFFPYKLFRTAQVVIFLSIGLVLVVINVPGSLGGIAFFVYGLVLALRFGYFERGTQWKFLVITLLLMAAAIGSTTVHNTVSLGYAVGIAAISASFLYLYWAAFADEIEEYRRESEQLREEAIANRVLVRFGQNVAGVTHNLKSRLMSIEGFSDLIAEEVGSRSMTSEYVELQRKGIGQLHEMIEGLLYAVRSYQRALPERVELGRVVRSAVEMLRANRSVRGGIGIVVRLCTEDEIYGSPQSIIQILDALIQNAWESVADSSDQTIEIETRIDGSYIVTTVRDRGTGLPFCVPCEADDCLDCPNFRLGKSTKPEGSGVGVVHLRELLREMRGRLKYDSSPSTGTSVSAWFPRPQSGEYGED